MQLVQLRKDDDGYHLHLHPGEMFFPTVEEFDAYLNRVDDVVEVRTFTSRDLIFTYPHPLFVGIDVQPIYCGKCN